MFCKIPLSCLYVLAYPRLREKLGELLLALVCEFCLVVDCSAQWPWTELVRLWESSTHCEGIELRICRCPY